MRHRLDPQVKPEEDNLFQARRWEPFFGPEDDMGPRGGDQVVGRIQTMQRSTSSPGTCNGST